MADVEGDETKVGGRRPRNRAVAAVARKPATSPDAVEIAMSEMVATGQTEPSRQLLEKQSRLIDAQLVELKLKRLFWLSIALLAAMLVAAVLYAVAAAAQSRAFVMEPLRTPPALAQRGIDGMVLASRIVDELRSLEANTSSVRAPSSYSSSWEEDVKIAIPQTGVSLGEAWNYLRSWLGNDTRVQGEAFATEDGIGITVRTSTMPGRTFTGSASDLDRLVREAAMALYRDTQPYRYGVYMSAQPGGGDEQVAAYRLLVERGGREALWGYRGWGLWHRQRGEYREELARYHSAEAIDPSNAGLKILVADAHLALGDFEAALANYRRTIQLFDQGGTGSITPAGVEYMRLSATNLVASLTGDLQTAARLTRQGRTTSFGNTLAAALSAEAGFHVQLHDLSTARRLLDQAGPILTTAGSWGPDIVPFNLASAEFDLERRQPGTAIELLDGAAASLRSSGHSDEGVRLTLYPMLARAWAQAGEHARAEAAVAQLPLDCYSCLVARGDVAAMIRDWRAAERWYGEAIRRAPSIPSAYSLNGRMLLARGNIDGAIAQFREAHRRGPRFADPLKFWGDALAARGDLAGAEERYRAAAERAPRWPALHIDLGRALWRLKRYDEARTHFRAAAALELPAADQARLQRIMSNISRRS